LTETEINRAVVEVGLDLRVEEHDAFLPLVLQADVDEWCLALADAFPAMMAEADVLARRASL